MRLSFDTLALPCLINASLSFAYTMDVPSTFPVWLRNAGQNEPRTRERVIDNTELDRRAVISNLQVSGRAQ